ncbi:MAG: OsmC family protein [Bacteroidota bacterium]|nr:OsmC family protein [Bacteroidota bacterium]
MLEIDVNWKDKMAFDTELNGHSITIDAEANVGGEDKGPRPKPLMLIALGGCTAMDVISILKKMRVEPDKFNVKVQAEETNEHPKHFSKFHITYQFWGKDLPMAKIEKAVKLSEERYCGVTLMLNKAAEITNEIQIMN